MKSEDGCATKVKNHKWGKVKAEGWFFSKEIPEDKGYCPEHVPEWVASWRAKKNQARAVDGTVVLSADCLGCGKKIEKPVGQERPTPWIHTDTREVECGRADGVDG